MQDYYKEDLAYIHDAGHSEFALNSAPKIIEILNTNVNHGLVVDLGCGTGLLTQELIKANYEVFGIDISPSMIAIAQKRVPSAEFKIGSIFKEMIPNCIAVTMIGESINYLFDPENSEPALVDLFRRIYTALNHKGVFIFDFLEPGQNNRIATRQSFTEGDDWIVLVEKKEDQINNTLTRKIISFRQIGSNYRRSDEIHRICLYHSTEIMKKLRQIGFRVRLFRGYGEYRLGKKHAVIIARK